MLPAIVSGFSKLGSLYVQYIESDQTSPSDTLWQKHQSHFTSEKHAQAQGLYKQLCPDQCNPKNPLTQLEAFFQLRALADSTFQNSFTLNCPDGTEKKPMQLRIAGNTVARVDSDFLALSLSPALIDKLDNGKETVEQQALRGIKTWQTHQSAHQAKDYPTQLQAVVDDLKNCQFPAIDQNSPIAEEMAGKQTAFTNAVTQLETALSNNQSIDEPLNTLYQAIASLGDDQQKALPRDDDMMRLLTSQRAQNQQLSQALTSVHISQFNKEALSAWKQITQTGNCNVQRVNTLKNHLENCVATQDYSLIANLSHLIMAGHEGAYGAEEVTKKATDFWANHSYLAHYGLALGLDNEDTVYDLARSQPPSIQCKLGSVQTTLATFREKLSAIKNGQTEAQWVENHQEAMSEGEAKATYQTLKTQIDSGLYNAHLPNESPSVSQMLEQAGKIGGNRIIYRPST